MHVCVYAMNHDKMLHVVNRQSSGTAHRGHVGPQREAKTSHIAAEKLGFRGRRH
jgi:hypothetical protein